VGRLILEMNVTLDGCCDHREVVADEELHRYATALMDATDGVLFGRVTYELMESAWPEVARKGEGPKSVVEFARKLDAKRKYVVSSTRGSFDWSNTFLVKGELAQAVAKLKEGHPRGLLLGGPRLAASLERLGLIDEYCILIQPILAGHGPTLFQGLERPARLKLIDLTRFASGVMALRYRP
jgi:dihydrofolate reductase